MALLDFLKNKKEAEKSKKPATKKAVKASVATEKAVEAVKEAKTPKPKAVPVSSKFSYEVVKAPHISEKATILAEKNQYMFTISSRANKPEIRKAIEGIYGVNVVAVNVIQIPKKKRRLGRTEGYKKAYRKAVVTIKEGQKIEVF